MPGQHDLDSASRDHLADGRALQEVAAHGRMGDVEVREPAAAVVPRPGEVLAVGLTVRADDIEVAVSVQIVHDRHVGERRADGGARPGAARIAWIGVPPAARHDVGEVVAIQIPPLDEDRAPRQGRLEDVPAPEVERQRAGVDLLPHLDHRRVRRAVAPVGPEDVEVAVVPYVADPEVVRAGGVYDDLAPRVAGVGAQIDADLVRVGRLVHLRGHEVEIAVIVHVRGLEGVQEGD